MFSIFPTIAAKRYTNDFSGGGSQCQEFSIFLTMGLLVSSFALPIVLARNDVVSFIFKKKKNYKSKCRFILFLLQIKYGAAYLTLGGNVVVYATIFIFFVLADNDNLYGGGI